MQRLSEDHGVQTILRALRFIEIRLATHPEAAPMGHELGECRQELLEAQENFEQAHTQRLAATAEVSYRDDVVDSAVINLAEEALRVFDDRRDDERYLILFPISPTEAISSTASHRQHRFVHQLIQTLRQRSDLGSLSAHALIIEERQTALEAALVAREKSFTAETQAVQRRNEAIDEACRCYNRSHARLQLLFRDGARIQSFYPHLPNAQSPETERP